MEVLTQSPAPVKRTCDDCRHVKPNDQFLFLLIGENGANGAITICRECAKKTATALISQLGSYWAETHKLSVDISSVYPKP